MVTGTRPVTGLTNSCSTGPLPPCWQSPPSSAQLAVEGVAARSRRGSSWWSSAFERLEAGRPNGTVSKRQSRPSPRWSRGPGPGHVFQQDAHNTTGGEGADEAEGKGLALRFKCKAHSVGERHQVLLFFVADLLSDAHPMSSSISILAWPLRGVRTWRAARC